MTNPKVSVFKNLKFSNLTAICIGIVYLWFGLLKFFPDLSPAEDIAKRTINVLSFGFIPSYIAIILLAIWETGLGILLIINKYSRLAIRLALIHMLFTFTPLILFPELTFSDSPFSFTLLGQYIVKNIIIISVLLTLLNKNYNTQTLKVK
ncbi:hypothetical protein GCM10023311_10760 [Flaviramulus aquimarinus]|uniref:Doxx family protein n=1 Tax=Flaviramulus aquimarinus TaxID=1170456 RepID=A0ABP9EY88_9FLAO